MHREAKENIYLYNRSTSIKSSYNNEDRDASDEAGDSKYFLK